MQSITTPDRLAQYLGIPAGVDEARLRDALQAASRDLERHTQRSFTPRRATLYHSVDRRDPTYLFLEDDLLALESVNINDGSSIPLGDVLRLPSPPHSPAAILALKHSRVFTWAHTPIQAVALTGIWGWHEDWPNAWRSSNDQSLASLSAEAAYIPVINAAAPDAEGRLPRFQVGQLIRIGMEYMRVLEVSSDPDGADELQVRRGAQGTTASSHPLNAPIDVFQPAPDVEMLVLRWAAWLYKHPERPSTLEVPPALSAPLALLRRMTL